LNSQHLIQSFVSTFKKSKK
jgi:hypothetical protein